MTSYASEEAAAERAAQLQRVGIWPAIIPTGDGRFRLSVNLPGRLEDAARERGLPFGHDRGHEPRDRRIRGQR
jgi:hypothetical protein